MKQIQRGVVAVIALVSVQCTDASAPDSDLPTVESPPGRIAFSTQLPNRGGYLYIANIDGSGLRQLPLREAYYSRPRWSPDRRRLVVSRMHPDTLVSSIYIIDVDGPSGAIRVADGFDPAWSPDGSKIVFAAGGALRWPNVGIHIMNADGSDVRRLTFPNDPGQCSEGSTASDWKPDWSPDGRRILFQRDIHTSDSGYDCGLDGWGYIPQVHVVNVDGTGARRLRSVDSSPDSDPAWSPDARSIAFSMPFDGLYVIDDEGSSPPRRIDMPNVGWGLSPSWSADGKKLLFLSVTPPNNMLAVVAIESGITHVIGFPTVQGLLLGPAWSR